MFFNEGMDYLKSKLVVVFLVLLGLLVAIVLFFVYNGYSPSGQMVEEEIPAGGEQESFFDTEDEDLPPGVTPGYEVIDQGPPEDDSTPPDSGM